MTEKKTREKKILFPPASYVDEFHNILIQQKGDPGYFRKDMVQGSLDWAQLRIFGQDSYQGIFKRSAAILYAYTLNHAFLDGNKRTALMTTSFFLFINGYTLNIPDDAPELAVSIVENASKKALVEDEIERTAIWVKTHVTTPWLRRALYRLMRSSLPEEAEVQALFSHRAWKSYYNLWRTETVQRFKTLLTRWPGLRDKP